MPEPLQSPIVVIGSINSDLICRTARVPLPGETVTGSDLLVLAGGKGANQAVAAARLGATVHLVGRVGDDASGRRLLDGLRRDRVGTGHVTVTPGVASGAAIIIVDRRGDNRIIVSPGANARVTPADVDAALPIVRSAAVVVMQLEIPLATVRHAAGLCRRLGVAVILDPAPVPPRGLPLALYDVTVLTPNQPEAALLVDRGAARSKRIPDPERIASKLLHNGAGFVVLKLGAQGALLMGTGVGPVRAKPPRVRVVDSTAAGDAFTAALAVATAEGQEWEQALAFANAAGALCCTRIGAQPALPDRDAVDQLLRRTRRRHGSPK